RAPRERVGRAAEDPAIDRERHDERERECRADREEAAPLDVGLDRGRRDDREPDAHEGQVAPELAVDEPRRDEAREQQGVAPAGGLEPEEQEGRGGDAYGRGDAPGGEGRGGKSESGHVRTGLTQRASSSDVPSSRAEGGTSGTSDGASSPTAGRADALVTGSSRVRRCSSATIARTRRSSSVCSSTRICWIWMRRRSRWATSRSSTSLSVPAVCTTRVPQPNTRSISVRS